MSEDAPGTAVPRVGLLYDSVSANTGDIAIGIAGAQELARHGLADVTVLDPFAPATDSVDAVVVGGGELIRPIGDAFYDVFRLAGGTVLNSAGVWQAAEGLELFKDYAVVSARSSVEAEVLSRYVDDVRVVPDTTTTMESAPYRIPGVEDGEPVVGVHVVPHTLALCPDLVELIDAIPHKKVFIPFTHYNYDDSFMRAVPFDRTNATFLPRLSPLELHGAIGGLTYVVTSSLHASLFAYSQSVPFATVHQEKVWNYFSDRGLQRLVFRSCAELRAALEEIEAGEVDLAGLVAADKAAVRAAYADYAAAIRHRAGHRSVPRSAPVSSELQSERLTSSQREGVIHNRDSVLHQLYLRVLTAERGERVWHDEADRLAARVAELEAAAAVPADQPGSPGTVG
ncbi:polysaccharide pyruvyl transferase family protein [Actinotalea sp. Marseille-Q4924]|uniref:polysaccharide pyruvyl transferase family protein n=1 Tax=Actinotalea sp. Marseille-Q4924 TaxID=2866571 RepID=UPI001CE3DE31|nr:polysaccharide pyruvyl transferase family protein [Actinotalea sp. Marseille-Q4924]